MKNSANSTYSPHPQPVINLHSGSTANETAGTNPVAFLGPPLLTMEDLVRHTQIPESTLYGLMARGEGPLSMKIGRQRRFLIADVLEWYAERTGRTAA